MRGARWIAMLIALACAPSPGPAPPVRPEPRVDPAPASRSPVRVPPPEEKVERLAPPEVAYAHGWMPLASTGAERFVREHPTYDGRGVLIAILDTGVDPGVPGLRATSTGEPKLVDVRDFSGEGVVRLARVTPRGDSVEIAGRKLGGFGRVVALNTGGPYYAGTLRELSLGEAPAADLDGSGEATDTLALVVTRATDGWVVLADTDGDGSLAGERPVRDYQVARETFGWAPRGRAPRAHLAANFTGGGGEPALSLVLALDSHGTHVAGIAGANDLYGVKGFDGVAPGAQLLGLKISNRAHGSVSTSGAIIAAMDHAIRFAAARRQPLVINLSFGVGNEREGEARIDHLVDSVLAQHPGVVLTVSVGNDGPGLSTVGVPGSASRGISVGGTVPSVFLPPGPGGAATELVADFSARGGEVARPDIIAPAVAYSSVPLWNAGDEVKQGTSMAAPHVAGLAALLLSALPPERRPADSRALRQALMVTARPSAGMGHLDEGRGLPDVDAAYRWLLGGGIAPEIDVTVPGTGTSGAWIMAGPSGGKSGVQRFEIRRRVPGPPVTYTLRSDAPWLTGPRMVTLAGGASTVELRYTGNALAAPGAYTGVVSGWPADTLAGPGFRLVTTIVVPAGLADTGIMLRNAATIAPGEALRSFFTAESGRPFEVRVSSAAGQRGIAYLHEPGGAPYREAGSRPLGGLDGVTYRVDARDAVGGQYQVAASPLPGAPMTLSAAVVHAPFTISAARSGDAASATLMNVSGRAVRAGVELRLRGAERQDILRASGSAVQRIPFDIPAWAAGLEVDVAMDREQWGRFTDFGVTVLDTLGRQVAQDPLEYAFGRLSTLLPEDHGGTRAELTFMPGFADSTDRQPWSVTATIRLYADSAVAVAPVEGSEASLAAGQRASARFRLPPDPWLMPPGFAPLGVILAREGEQVWTRETGLDERNGP